MEESSSSQSAETAETETIVITPTELEKLDLKNELEKVIEEQTQNKSTSASDSTTDDEHKAEECTADEKDDNEETTEEKTDDLEKTTSESKNADESPQTVDDDTVSSLKSDDFTEEPDIDRQKIKKTYRNESRSEAIVGAGDKSSTGAKVVETDSAETSAKKDLTQEAASVDPNSLQKRMKNKLCTLLNHTPLVMQVKNVNWIAPERKSPALLNSSAKTVVQINDDDGSTSDNKEDKESKSKFTIVSDEKSNLSPSEIEDMISSGKQIKSNEKLSPVQKEIADKLKNPKTAQSTSKAAADAGVKKKECLKRIQAKMYENLKKVLQEVDSFPVKDKASLSIKPVQSSTVDETKAYKSVSAAKPPEKVKENKPCYMSTYRERKRSQDDSEDSRTGKSVSDGEVIEIDSQPGSPVNLPKTVKAKIISSPLKGVINLDEDEEVVKVPKKRGRPKRISNADRPGDNDEDYTPEKDNVRTGSPFKKAIAKRYSESEKTDSPDQQNTPRKRGRPRKYFNTPPTAANNTPKSNDSQNDDLSPPPSNNDVKSKESEPSSSKQNESPDKPEGPSRKRGRPPKNKNITPEKTESKLEDTITDPLADYPAPPESKIQSEVKTPKKRGRKSKAELEALRKKQAEQSDKVETVETDKENYTQSKISGRKRKVVNYSLLNGEDSDLDEPDVKLNRRVTIDNGTSEDEEDDKSSHDEYGSSNNKNNKRVRTDDEEDEEQVPKSKQLKKDVGTDDKDENTIVERPEDKSDQKTDVTSDNKNNNINENHKVKQGDPIESNKTDGNEDHASEDAEQSNEKEKSENADEIQCGVCDVKIQKSLWAEHKRKAHNDLAWTSDEKPLVSVTESHLILYVSYVLLLYLAGCPGRDSAVVKALKQSYFYNQI